MSVVEVSQEIVPAMQIGQKLQLVYIQMSDEEFQRLMEEYAKILNNPDGLEEHYTDAGYEGNQKGAEDHARRTWEQLEYMEEGRGDHDKK